MIFFKILHLLNFEKIFCAKFDIRKAFNLVNKYYILKRMANKGFPNLFISSIQAWIHDFHFSSQSMVHQKTSFLLQIDKTRISSFLKLILYYHDVFSCFLDIGFLNNEFESLRTSHAQISHLLYADDFIVFGKANESNLNTLKHTLNYFYSSLGLSINRSKRSICISKFVSNFRDLSEIINTNCIDLKFIYPRFLISVN